jgi:hypothetical protein
MGRKYLGLHVCDAGPRLSDLPALSHWPNVAVHHPEPSSSHAAYDHASPKSIDSARSKGGKSHKKPQ